MDHADGLGVGAPLAAESSSAFGRLVALAGNASSDQADDAYAAMAQWIASPPGRGSHVLGSLQRLLAIHEIAAVHSGTLFAALTIHYNLCVGTIIALDNGSDHVRGLLQRLESGAAFGVFLATELGYGNNVVALETRAVFDEQTRSFALHSPSAGSYKFMPNTVQSLRPKIAVVMARVIVQGKDYGAAPFVVALSEGGRLAAGVRITPLGEKAGFGLDNAITSFDQVRVPIDALLGPTLLTVSPRGEVCLHEASARRRFLGSMTRVQSGKLCMAKGALGMAKAALDITVRYGEQRMTFSPLGPVPIAVYQNFSAPLASELASIVVLSRWIDALARRAEEDSPRTGHEFPEQLKNEIAIAKAQVTWKARDVVVRCRERCGAQGLFSENRFPGYYATLNGAITAEGDNAVIVLKAVRDFVQTPPVLPEGPAQPLLRPNWEVLRRLYGMVLGELREIDGISDAAQRFAAANGHHEKALQLATLYGVLTGVPAAAAGDPAPAELACVELHLIDAMLELAVPMVERQLLDDRGIRACLARRAALRAQPPGALLALVERFGLRQAGLSTPISQGDYVGWYASAHAAGGQAGPRSPGTQAAPVGRADGEAAGVRSSP